MSLPRRTSAAATAAADLVGARAGTAPNGAAINLAPDQKGVTTPAVDAIGATTRKGNGLVEAVNAAIDELTGNGAYGQVLKRRELDNEAVRTSEISPPGLPKTD